MAKNNALNFNLPSADDLFSTEESRAEARLEKVINLNPSEISDFPNHPFKVRMDAAMQEMTESVKQYGVLVPALVRPKPDGGYEMVAGHRRKKAAELANLTEIPCIVRQLTDDEATIIMVDSNLQREQILPSAKGTISGKEFMERVFREEHMPHAMVVGIVQAITTTLGDWLAKGYTVEIEGLGFFSTTLKCTHPVMNKKEVRAESVKMSTVKFRPGIEFKRYVAGKMELERADKRFFPDKPKAMGDMVAREKSMMDFLEANVCITRAEYSRLVHVTARRASRDLQTFIDSGVIRKRGAGRSVVYVKG